MLTSHLDSLWKGVMAKNNLGPSAWSEKSSLYAVLVMSKQRFRLKLYKVFKYTRKDYPLSRALWTFLWWRKESFLCDVNLSACKVNLLPSDWQMHIHSHITGFALKPGTHTWTALRKTVEFLYETFKFGVCFYEGENVNLSVKGTNGAWIKSLSKNHTAMCTFLDIWLSCSSSFPEWSSSCWCELL